jgi:hypothetical protein
MLHFIKDLRDPLLNLIKDDPVRPNIYQIERILGNKEVVVLMKDDNPLSVICISYQDFIPAAEKELVSSDNPEMAIFYSIWSYKPGAGKRLLFKMKDYIKENKPEIKRLITLSPQTFTASRFHMSNGAKVLRVNEDTVNYEYT